MPSSHANPVPLGLLVRRWPERRLVVFASALAVLLGLFAAVLGTRDAVLGLAFLAVVPVVLVSLEFGQRAGLAVALIAFAAVLLAAAAGRPELGTAAIAVRGATLLAAGAVAGRFSDRMRAAHEREERLLRSGLRLSEASRRELLTGIVVSEAMRTSGVNGARAGLDGLPATSSGSLVGSRTAVPMVVHGVHVGTLEAYHAEALEPEDRSALKLLARQAAVVAEGLRLLELDGERAALEARLREARDELLESRSGTGLLLRAEEAGRRKAAEKLHEDLAQVLSAVLLSMRMLERKADADDASPLQELHEQISHVLSDVRDIARELRPVVLDQLGLAPALEALGRAAQDRGSHAAVTVGALPAGLPDQVETAVFRLVEDALTTDADVTVGTHGHEVVIDVDVDGPAAEMVLALRARAESAGGTLSGPGSPAGGVGRFHVTMPAG